MEARGELGGIGGQECEMIKRVTKRESANLSLWNDRIGCPLCPLDCVNTGCGLALASVLHWHLFVFGIFFFFIYFHAFWPLCSSEEWTGMSGREQGRTAGHARTRVTAFQPRCREVISPPVLAAAVSGWRQPELLLIMVRSQSLSSAVSKHTLLL